MKDEVQQVKVSSAPIGGTFTIHLGRLTTDPLPFNATNEQIESAVQFIYENSRKQCEICRKLKPVCICADLCAACHHPRKDHYTLRGTCYHDKECHCRRFRVIK